MPAKEGNQPATNPASGRTKLELPPDVKLLRTLEGQQSWVMSVAFDPEGRTLASGSSDKTVKLWEPASGKLLRTLESHTGFVDRVAFSPDGRLRASKSGDASIRRWRRDVWETVAVIPEPTSQGFWIPALAFHPTLPLLAGEKASSLPPLLHGRVHADFREEEAYFRMAFDLILSLYRLPPNHPALADLRESLTKEGFGRNE